MSTVNCHGCACQQGEAELAEAVMATGDWSQSSEASPQVILHLEGTLTAKAQSPHILWVRTENEIQSVSHGYCFMKGIQGDQRGSLCNSKL